MHSPLLISYCQPVAKGRIRHVYQHPDNPDWLIKVIRPEILKNQLVLESQRMRKLRRLGPYLIFAREIEEYLASHASDPAGLSFTQKIVGLVETDIGLGIVVQAAKNRQEQLAPTIDRLIQENCFGETEQMALQIFIEKFLASPVVVSDLHWRNLVYAFTPENGDHFVMIDGLGSSNVFPIKSWFPSINRRSKAARVRRLKRKLASILPEENLIPSLRP